MNLKAKLSFLTIFLLSFIIPAQFQTTCSNVKSFSNSVLSTNENQRFSLLDYFQGPNLQFKFNSTNNYNSYIPNNGVASGTQYTNIFPSFQVAKVYKQSQSFGNILGMLVTSSMPNQILLFNTPTLAAPLSGTTNITLSSDLTCTDFEFINNLYAIVDCYNTTSSSHVLQIYSLQTGSLTTQKILPQLWQGSTGNVRTLQKIMIGINNYIILILNQFLTGDSFIEIARITLTNQVAIHTLPPINKQFFDISSNFSIISMTQAANYLILAVNQNYMYKLALNFTYVQFTMQYTSIQLGTTATLLNIQSQYIGNVLNVFYAYSENNVNSIKQVDWTYDIPVAIANYQVDASMKTIQMQILQDFLVTLITNNDTTNFRSQIVVYQKGTIDFQNWFESTMPIIYQNQPVSLSFGILSSYLNNQLLILSNGQTTLLNYQQLLQFSLPTITLSQTLTTYPDSISLTVYCMGNYIALNSTITGNQIIFTSQASSILSFKPINMNTIYIQQLVNSYGCQTLYSEFPGATALTIPPYFQGPDLQYSLSIASNSSNWTQPQYSFFNVNPLYTDLNFILPIPQQYTTSQINLVEIIEVVAGVSEWLVQITNNGVSSLYLIVEDLNFKGFFQNNQIILQEPIFIYDRTVLSSFTGLITSLKWISPLSFMYSLSTSPDTLNIHVFGEDIDKVYSEPIYETPTAGNIIQSITYVDNKAYIAMTNSVVILTFDSLINSILQLKRIILQAQILTYSSFANFNDYAIFDLAPIKIVRDWNRQQIIYIQTRKYVLIADYQTQFIYSQLMPTNNLTNFVIGVTNNSLVFIQNQYTEYSIANLTNIIQTKLDLPLYSSQGHTFSVQTNLIKSTKQYLYLLDTAQNNAVLIIEPGMPMFCMIKKVLTLGASFSQAQFLFINNQNQFSETLTLLTSTNYFAVYNIYYQSTLTVSGFINGTLKTVQQKKQDNFWFNLGISSASNKAGTIATFTIPYQIQMNYNQDTVISLNSSSADQLRNFITIPDSHAQEDPISFPFNNKLFQGIVKNYYIKCPQCNTSIIMQNAFGMNYLLSNNTDIVTVSTSYQNYSFAQSLNKIYRIGSATNKIYDFAQLPFSSNTHFCENIVVDKTEQFTISACWNFLTWRFYVTSFVSTEPHVIGHFDAPMVKAISKMMLIDNLLFIVDGAIPLINKFNGVHIFYKILTDFDIVKTLTANTYKFFAATQAGMLYYNDVAYTSPSLITFSNWAEYNLISNIISQDPALQSIMNAPFDSSLSGVKVFDFNYQTAAEFSSYQMIVVFKNWHSYDTLFNLQPQRTQPVLQIKARLNRYAFYENQGNIQTTIDNNGFIMFSTFLPDYLVGVNNYSQHIIVAYDRTNTSGTQLTELAGATGNQYPQTIILSGISFYGKNLDFTLLPQNISGNHSALLISPDNYSLIACTLSHSPTIYFKTTENAGNSITLTAYSEFSYAQLIIHVDNEKAKKIKNKVWIVFVVLAIVITLFTIMILIQVIIKKYSGEGQEGGSNQGLLEEN